VLYHSSAALHCAPLGVIAAAVIAAAAVTVEVATAVAAAVIAAVAAARVAVAAVAAAAAAVRQSAANITMQLSALHRSMSAVEHLNTVYTGFCWRATVAVVCSPNSCCVLGV
jgi:L,D-peptidoglycan transpeptidase YkuD (ErfK/YbiS/YcfS/YnhG family)